MSGAIHGYNPNKNIPMKPLLILTAAIALSSCSSYNGVSNPHSLAMERDETRIFDEPSPASLDESSPLNDVMLQRGRVGMVAARF